VAGVRSRSRRRPPIAEAVSAGGIVIRVAESGPEVVLGKRLRERDGPTWSLPKGTPDGAERLDETAVREVTEETGLRVRIVAPVGSIEYFFFQDGRRVHKTVHYYLMEALSGDLDDHDREFEEVRWVPLVEAESLMSFPTERQVLARALPIARIERGPS
jgi:8-oxo-dGTP pyrophosphatase MutT (NUDIX family)